ncbi:MAG: hypothetical protein ACTSRU_10995 [Candidatus Hodarchaeales archaeon]
MSIRKYKGREGKPFVHMVHKNWSGSGKTNLSWRKKGSKFIVHKDFPNVKSAKEYALKKAKSMDLGSVSYYNSQANPTGFDVDYTKPKAKSVKKKRKVARKPKRKKDIFDVLGKLF